MSFKKLLLITSIAVFLLIALYLSVSAYIATSLTVQNPNITKRQISEIGEGSSITFKTSDNFLIKGWYFPSQNGKAIVFVHGAGDQNRVNEYYGTVEISKFLVERGYGVLLFDLRGAGESQEARLGFGQYEKEDVVAAYEFIRDKGFESKSIGIVANSMGAISTILAAEKISDVGGVILDSPASELKPIVTHALIKDHNVPAFLHPSVYFWAKALFNIDIDSNRPIDKVGFFENTPVLFIHGGKDSFIPPDHSKKLQERIPSSQRVIVENAEHVLTYKSDPNFYLSTLINFFESNLQ